MLIAGDLLGEDMTLKMLEAFVKELDVVAAGWDLEPCYWLEQGCVSKSWRWYEERGDFKHPLIKRRRLVVLEAVKAIEAVKAK